MAPFLPRKLFLVVLATLLLAGSGLVFQQARGQPSGQNITPVHVAMLAGSALNRSSPGYSPDVIRVVIGVNNTVVWTNNDDAPHTVTSTSGAFDSGLVSPGQSWNYTFTYPGTFDYYCTIHPWMKGEVIVEAPAGSGETPYSATQSYGGNMPSPRNPPGNIIAAAIFILLVVGLVLGEISARRTR